MPTETCPEDNCDTVHEFTSEELGNTVECNCESLLRIGRSNAGEMTLIHHPLNDMDDMNN